MSKNNALLNRGTSLKYPDFYLGSRNFRLSIHERGHYGVFVGSRKYKIFTSRRGLIKYLDSHYGYLLNLCAIDEHVSLVDLDTNDNICYLGIPSFPCVRKDESNLQLIISSDDEALFSDSSDLESGSSAVCSALCDF